MIKPLGDKPLNFTVKSGVTVIGLVDLDRKNKPKYLVIKCEICSKDEELFGDGLFVIRKNHLKNGVDPCGCARTCRWTKEQYAILCKRVEMPNITFKGLIEPFKGKYTKIALYCEHHGLWETHTINRFLSMKAGCPKCSREALTENLVKISKKTDEYFIEKFTNTGAFPEGTTFKKTDELDKQGVKSVWQVYCPECCTTNKSDLSRLSCGKRPCFCTKNKQTTAYINIISDGATPVALKFGVSAKPMVRLNIIGWSALFNVQNYGVWNFRTHEDCIEAENTCKRVLQCGILTKQEMRDGWSETTWVYNLDKIIDIYESFGGIRAK